MVRELEVLGMHCDGCVAKVTRALAAVPGVKKADATLQPPRATVESDTPVKLEALNAAGRSAGGYSFVEPSGSARKAESRADQSPERPEDQPAASELRPLFVVVGYILGGTILRAMFTGNFALPVLMSTFMGGFFVLFSLFKLIDLGGFAEGYATYDLLAMRSRFYALGYPFLELLLGVSYFAGTAPALTNAVTLVLMSIGAAGVLQALRAGREIQCACLGTALKLPMTTVTLVEDLAMAAMALAMLV